MIAKTDLSSAYKHVPIHPNDQRLLGIEWNGVTYVHGALPLGLQSAPKLFSAVADGLAWALHCIGVDNCVHYLDDFLFWGPPASPACKASLKVARELLERLGLATVAEKAIGPTTRPTFLGIEIDSVLQQLRLPSDKLSRLCSMLADWDGKRNASKHELQMLLGYLSHATTVVRPGRPFLRWLIDIAKKPRLAAQRVRLNLDCRADLAWWATFIEEWNKGWFSSHPSSWPNAGIRCLRYMGVRRPLREITKLVPAPVASVMGGRKHCNQGTGADINQCSCMGGGAGGRGTSVLFLSDNQAVVACLSKRTARDPFMAHLLRCLFCLEAHFGFEHSQGAPIWQKKHSIRCPLLQQIRK